MTRNSVLVPITLAVFTSNLMMISASLAAMPDQLYQEALRIAQKHSLRTQQIRDEQNRPDALSSSLVKSLFGRYYETGDSWDVAIWQFNHSLTPVKRTLENKNPSQIETGAWGVFHYEVLNVKNGIVPSVTIQVTQKKMDGTTIVDPQVTRLEILFNDQLVQSEKTYFFRGKSDGIKAFSDGIHSKLSPLELFPLDVPNITTGERIQPSGPPSLPRQVQSFGDTHGYKVDKVALERSSWFELDDFFGRPIQVLWQQGNPWPSYIKSSTGIAILVGQ